MNDELHQRLAQAEAIALTLQARLDQAEADAAAMRATLSQVKRMHTIVGARRIADDALAADHPGSAVLAVAEAARAYVQAGEYDNLADLLVALKGAVDRWGR